MTAVSAGAYVRNDRKDSEVTVKVKLDIATEHQTKVTTLEQAGWEHGWEIGGTYGHEVNWQVGVPENHVERKNKYEVTGKYVSKNVMMGFKGREDMELKRVSV